MNDICKRLKELRNGLHLSQEYIANYLNVNRATYTQMENGKRKITVEDLGKLSILFGVSTDYLIHGKPLNEKWARELKYLNASYVVLRSYSKKGKCWNFLLITINYRHFQILCFSLPSVNPFQPGKQSLRSIKGYESAFAGTEFRLKLKLTSSYLYNRLNSKKSLVFLFWQNKNVIF